MAERKAVSHYYPPEWTPSKGSLNKFQGQHPLRDRARMLDQGILIIRFEMPFNVWCEGCNAHIGKGVRYNAQKKAAGKYFSTPIWSFRMKCHLCPQWFEIQNDPKNSNFVCISGVRQKMEQYDPEDIDLIPIEKSEQNRDRLGVDAMYRLEHQTEDKRKLDEMAPRLRKLQKMSDERHKDDYAMSKRLRHGFRLKRRELQEQSKIDEQLNLGDLPLLPPSAEDAKEAKQVVYGENSAEYKRLARRKKLSEGSIFGAKGRKPVDDRTKQLLRKRRQIATALMKSSVK
eukprot:GCRY01003832.1.p1 GENE.GCRY01003832.1~~GCRY01003832.1.p1  ORF type:complete len:286 (+),score=13.54 GCRY01003832.1:165-1022(+)